MAGAQGTQQAVAVPNVGGANVSAVQVQQTIAGTPTTVDQQVVSIADSSGNVFDSLLDREERRLLELSFISSIDQNALAMRTRATERVTFTDRRGSTGRGSTR